MRKSVALAIIAGALFSSLAARAQTPIKLTSFRAEIRPEYDQRSTLVICDFTLPEGTTLPVTISLRFPGDAKLFAVASLGEGPDYVLAKYDGPTALADSWQSVAVQVEKPVAYHVEYYQPLSFDGDHREFSYVWPGDYATDSLVVSVLLPPGASAVTTNPQAQEATDANGAQLREKDFGPVAPGQAISLELTYTKSTSDLTSPTNGVQPSQPLGAGTAGRVMLSNYLPYIVGALGLALILGGSVYFWQSSRGRVLARERRHRRLSEREERPGTEVYCHQCGTRAHSGDRFCRVCGSRLRPPE